VRVRAVEAIARAPGAGKLKLVEVVRDAPQERLSLHARALGQIAHTVRALVSCSSGRRRLPRPARTRPAARFGRARPVQCGARMKSIIATVVLAVPFVAGCVDELDLGSQAAEVQASLVDDHFELVQDGSWGSHATAMVEVPIRDASGAQKMVASNAGPPFPPSYPVRGTCGVTFIAPHYAVTAAHCVSGTNVPQPTSTSLAVHSYDITAVAETWQLLFTGNVSGNFPNYVPLSGGPSADEIPGYQSQTTFCSVRARCSLDWGPKHNCSSFDADIALLHCPSRSSDAPWLRVAASDPQTGPVEMYWFHEVLYMPTDSSSSLERFTHYTELTSHESNFHYLDSRTNAILPLKSIPWPDGTARRRTGPAPGGTGTDLFGCHGTSGSGILQRNAQDQLELLGPGRRATRRGSRRACARIPTPPSTSPACSTSATRPTRPPASSRPRSCPSSRPTAARARFRIASPTRGPIRRPPRATRPIPRMRTTPRAGPFTSTGRAPESTT